MAESMASSLRNGIVSQLKPGDTVTFHLRDGRKILGTFAEIGLEHVTLENDSGHATVVIDFISSWERQEQKPPDALGSTRGGASQADAAAMLLKIKRRFDARREMSINPEPPDFAIPTDDIANRSPTLRRALQRLKDKYDYARKVNEVAPKFGRIQPISKELTALAEQFPSSIPLARQALHFRFLSSPSENLLVDGQRLAMMSGDVRDFRNLAAFALRLGKSEMAREALLQLFEHMAVDENSDTWHVFVRLVQETTNYSALANVLNGQSSDEGRSIAVFEAAVYLMGVVTSDDLPIELVRQKLDGLAAQELASRAIGHLTERIS